MKKTYGGQQVYFQLTLVRKYLAATILFFLLERKKLNEKAIWWPLYVGFFQPKKNEKQSNGHQMFLQPT
jgi:hypothetical protein